MLGVFGGSAVLGNAASYRLFGGRVSPRLLSAAVLVQAAPLVMLAVPTPAWSIVAALALSGLGNGVANPTIHAMITLRPPADVRAKVLTAIFTASGLGAPIALAVAGPAFASWGSRRVLAVAVASQCAAMLLLAHPTLRGLKD